MKNSEFINFREVETTAKKTKKWEVENEQSRYVIGVISWFGAWRKYAFYPCIDTVYDPDCLFTIGSFLEEKTKEHYDANK